MRRGEIYLCDFGDPIGHEPGYVRPAVMVSEDTTFEYDLPVVVPITRAKRGYRTHIELDGALSEVCYAQCELVGVLSGQRLVRKIGDVDALDMLKIEKILRRLLVLP